MVTSSARGRCCLLFSSLAAILTALPSSGALQERDLFAPGDALLTFDTETELEWLDLTQTTNQSADGISTSIWRDDLGFDWASGDQVAELWEHAGIVNTNNTPTCANAAGVSLLVGLLGVTIQPDAAHGLHEGGFTSKIRSRLSGSGCGSTAWFQSDSVHTSIASPDFGHYFVRAGAPGVCDNGLDDDGDGLIDLLDPGCEGPGDDSERSPGLICDDGLDNDGDGATDFPDDPGCAHTQWPSEQAVCNDGLDNDGDGATDFPADTGCPAGWWIAESSVCNDGLDNDGDGAADFPADPGCSGPSWITESPQCSDGGDNDADSFIDFPDDPECVSAAQLSETTPNCGIGFELVLLAPLLLLRRRQQRLRSRRRPGERGTA